MNKKKKRGPPFKAVHKVRRMHSFDADVINNLEATYPEGKRSSAVNSAVKEKLEREAK